MAHGDAGAGKWRGNWRMEWVASTLTRSRNLVYPALLTLMGTPRLPAVDWTDSPADLNGLVRLGERRNVVSARVPSGSARALQIGRSQWPCGLRRRSSTSRLLRLWVRIPPGAWVFVCCECCVLSGRGLCDGLIIRPEEFYRLWRVVVCDQEISKTRRLKPASRLWKYNHNGL